MVFIAIDKVHSGHGLDTYRTKWLVEDSGIEFLVFVVVTTVVVLAAAGIAWFQRRNELREIEHVIAIHSRPT